MDDKWLVCIPQCGLGNRLRFMSSCIFLAKKINRKIAILWSDTIKSNEEDELITRSQGVGISFDSLFENDIPVFNCNNIIINKRKEFSNGISYLLYGTIGDATFRYKNGELINYNNCSFLNIFKPCNETIRENLNFNDIKVIMCEGQSTFVLGNLLLVERELSNSKTQFYKSLVPVKEIHDIIDFHIPNLKEHICIHVRSYDKRYDPLENVHDSWLDENSYGMIDNVINYYIKFNELFNFEQPRFLLLSNSSKIKEHFSEKYPRMITVYDNNNFLRNDEGMKSALIEWYLMANCKLIWGSTSSSFSTEACFLNKIQKRILSKIYNVDKITENSLCARIAIDHDFDKIMNPENSRKIIVINP
jgi:hypothetical protein